MFEKEEEVLEMQGQEMEELETQRRHAQKRRITQNRRFWEYERMSKEIPQKED